MKNDNTSALSCFAHPTKQNANKYYDIYTKYICEQAKKMLITLDFVNSGDNITYILMKC